MKIATRAFLALVLLAIGWSAGYAQRTKPEFIVAIDAPAGNTRVQCVSGCELLGARDVESAGAGRMQTYEYGCSSAPGGRCMARVAGWLVK